MLLASCGAGSCLPASCGADTGRADRAPCSVGSAGSPDSADIADSVDEARLDDGAEARLADDAEALLDDDARVGGTEERRRAVEANDAVDIFVDGTEESRLAVSTVAASLCAVSTDATKLLPGSSAWWMERQSVCSVVACAAARYGRPADRGTLLPKWKLGRRPRGPRGPRSCGVRSIPSSSRRSSWRSSRCVRSSSSV